MKFYRLLILTLVFTTISACKDKPLTCEDFHQGTFEMRKPQEDYAVRIVREDSIQTETNLNTGEVTKAVVTWDNICNYQLRYTESTSPMAVNLIGKVLLVRIKAIQGKTYTYEAVLRGTQTVTDGQIVKLD